jgi:hypothetical protein
MRPIFLPEGRHQYLPATFGGSFVHVRERGKAFHAAMAA